MPAGAGQRVDTWAPPIFSAPAAGDSELPSERESWRERKGAGGRERERPQKPVLPTRLTSSSSEVP